jgi:hypothetical protein
MNLDGDLPLTSGPGAAMFRSSDCSRSREAAAQICGVSSRDNFFIIV